MKRHDVHLLEQVITARQVGARHGEAVILVVLAGAMHRAGHVFCRSTNNVWLVDHVPPQFIDFEAGPGVGAAPKLPKRHYRSGQ